MECDYDYSPQEGQWPTNHILNPQPFVEIEDMKDTISRQLQNISDLHQRQQWLQSHTFTQMEHQLQMEAHVEMEPRFADVSQAQMQESWALQKNHESALQTMHRSFWQEAMPEWSGHIGQAMRPYSRNKQVTPKTGAQHSGPRASVKTEKLSDDRLGNSGATTLMVRNIPVRYTQEMLLKEWPNGGNYDFLYLPICIKKKCNTSFAFINFISPEAAREFADRWHHERLLFFSARKPLDISLADLQGLEKNLLQCMNNKTSQIRNVRFQPAVFKGAERVSVEKVMKDMRQKLNPNQSNEGEENGHLEPLVYGHDFTSPESF